MVNILKTMQVIPIRIVFSYSQWSRCFFGVFQDWMQRMIQYITRVRVKLAMFVFHPLFPFTITVGLRFWVYTTSVATFQLDASTSTQPRSPAVFAAAISSRKLRGAQHETRYRSSGYPDRSLSGERRCSHSHPYPNHHHV